MSVDTYKGTILCLVVPLVHLHCYIWFFFPQLHCIPLFCCFLPKCTKQLVQIKKGRKKMEIVKPNSVNFLQIVSNSFQTSYYYACDFLKDKICCECWSVQCVRVLSGRIVPVMQSGRRGWCHDIYLLKNNEHISEHVLHPHTSQPPYISITTSTYIQIH